MAKNQGKTSALNPSLLAVWQDTTLWGIVMYFGLLTLNIRLGEFVEYYVPLQLIGWIVATNAILFMWFRRDRESAHYH